MVVLFYYRSYAAKDITLYIHLTIGSPVLGILLQA